MPTSQMTFFIATHFLTKRVRETTEGNMSKRVKELSADKTNHMAEELEEGQINERKNQLTKKVDEHISSAIFFN